MNTDSWREFNLWVYLRVWACFISSKARIDQTADSWGQTSPTHSSFQWAPAHPIYSIHQRIRCQKLSSLIQQPPSHPKHTNIPDLSSLHCWSRCSPSPKSKGEEGVVDGRPRRHTTASLSLYHTYDHKCAQEINTTFTTKADFVCVRLAKQGCLMTTQAHKPKQHRHAIPFITYVGAGR